MPAAPEPMDEQESRLRKELEFIKERWLKKKDEEVSWVKEAFYDSNNLISLGGLGALTITSAVLMPPMFPLLASVTVAWELVWLTLASQSDRFRRSVRARKNAAALSKQEEKRDAVLTALPVALKAQHEAAQAIAREIRSHTENLEEGSELLDETVAKLDYLLENYGRMLLALHRIQLHMSSPEDAGIAQKVATLEKELQGLEAGRLRSAKEKNLEVLRQRLDRSKKSKEEKEYLEVSLDTLENTLKLVRDRVIAASTAQGIATSLDDVIVEMGKHRDYMDAVESQMHKAQEAAMRESAIGNPAKDGFLDLSEGPRREDEREERERVR